VVGEPGPARIAASLGRANQHATGTHGRKQDPMSAATVNAPRGLASGTSVTDVPAALRGEGS